MSESAEIIRVLVVDDHDLLREGVSTCLGCEDDITVVGMASDGETAIRLVEELSPDVVVMDLVMPGMGGVAATKEIVAGGSSTRVLALTSFTDNSLVRSALEAGATSFQFKSVDASDLVSSVRITASGQSTLAPGVTRLMARGRDMLRDLTPRELEVADLLAAGNSNAAIAEQLYVSVYTVKNHVSKILMKFQVHSRTEAVAMILNSRHFNQQAPARTGST